MVKKLSLLSLGMLLVVSEVSLAMDDAKKILAYAAAAGIASYVAAHIAANQHVNAWRQQIATSQKPATTVMTQQDMLTVALTSSFNAFGVGLFRIFSVGWDILSTKFSLREILMASGFYHYQKLITNEQEKRFATLNQKLKELNNQYDVMEKALDESLKNNSNTTTTIEELDTSVRTMKEEIDSEKNSLVLKQEKIERCIQQLTNIENKAKTDENLAARVSKQASDQEPEIQLLIHRLEALEVTLEQNRTALMKTSESCTQLITTQHKNLANEVEELMKTTERRELQLKGVIKQELSRLKEALVKKETTVYISDARNQEITQQIKEELINKRKSVEDLVRNFAAQFDRQVTGFQDKVNTQLNNYEKNIVKIENTLGMPKSIKHDSKN